MTFQYVLIVGFPLVVAITFHEAAHAFAAYICGDTTAKRMGRLTLNPIKHIDLFGTILFPITLLMVKAPFMFGYAKPVPINPRQFYHYRFNLIIVAVSGPLMNICLAMVSWLAYLFLTPEPQSVIYSLMYSVQINLVLAVFNMLPILPLDGGRILSALLPSPLDRKYMNLERYGQIILLALISMPILSEYVGVSFNPLGWVISHGIESIKQLLRINF